MRVMFVDILRLLALLQMVNGHTLDAVLADSLRTGVAFERYGYLRGLVSVAFMVVAGISFQLTTLARLERHHADRRAVRRRFTRALQIVAVGYFLQAHAPSVYLDPTRGEAALRTLLRCEVLQCIGFGLLLLELLALACRSARAVVAACTVLSLASFALAPYGELASRIGPPSWWRALIGHGQGSQFPLLPWSGYVFAGVVIGALALPEAGKTTHRRRVLGLVGAALASALLSRVAYQVWPAVATVKASSIPWFVLEKLAAIGLVLAALAWLTRHVRALPSPLAALGSETLVLFVFHLELLYGGRWALAHRFGHSLDWPHALALAALNVGASALFGLAYHHAKALLRARRYASLEASQRACTERSPT